MAITAREVLKTWFETGDKPLQSQFWNWLDSYWHKQDTLPLSAIDETELESKIQDEIALAAGGASGVIEIVVTGSDTVTLPDGKLLVEVVVIGAEDTEVKVGITSGGDEVSLGVIGSNGWAILYGPWYANGSDVTIHLTAVSAAFKLYLK
jgi:hypothetical protein